MGALDLRRIQLGKESSHGTPVPATSILTADLSDWPELVQEFIRPNDLSTGRTSEYETSDVASQIMKATLEANATYRNLVHFFGMALKGGVSGAGGASPYTWTFAPGITSLDNPDSYTLEYGDDQQAYQSQFVVATSLQLSGQSNKALRVKCPIIGQTKVANAFTGSLSNTTNLNPVKLQTAKLYLDSSWAGLGGTLKSQTLIDFDAKWVSESGDPFIPLSYADGNLYHSAVAQQKRHLAIDATFAFNATTAGLFSNFTAQTKTFMQIKFAGPAISGGNAGLILNACLVPTSDPAKLSARGGEDVVKLTFVSLYDATSGDEWQAILTTDIASVP